METVDEPEEAVDNARRRPWRLVGISALAGILLAVVWSHHFVDVVIAGGLAMPFLGDTPLADVPLGDGTAAIAFAFITGFAGMFTACNVAVFCALAPLSGSAPDARSVLAAVARAIGILMFGAVLVAGLYGTFVVLIGGNVPQLSDGYLIGNEERGLSGRLVQSAVVFSTLGALMLWRGLTYAGIARTRFSDFLDRNRRAELLFLGGMIGAFVIGRPWPPFRHLLGYAVDEGNPALGFATLAMQSVGNALGVAILFTLLALATRGGMQRWMQATSGRVARIATAAFVMVGVFFLMYWGLKMGYRADLMWWPEMPY